MYFVSCNKLKYFINKSGKQSQFYLSQMFLNLSNFKNQKKN